jgi:adenosine deaminase
MAQAICAEAPGFPVRPEDFDHVSAVSDFHSFLAWWRLIEPLKGLDAIRPVLAQHVHRLRREQVVYAEVMVSASKVAHDPAEATEHWAALRAWLTELTEPDLAIGLLVVFSRGKRPEEVESLVDRVVPLFEAGSVVGIAMAGIERGNPVRNHARALARCHEAGMGIEIHAGEWCGPESIKDALDHGRPHRLGHAVSLFREPHLVERVMEQGIHIEMCPTSNLKTGVISSVEELPLPLALDRGLSFSINTDDPGTFGCSMTSEYALATRVWGLSSCELARIYENSLAARFPHNTNGKKAQCESPR